MFSRTKAYGSNAKRRNEIIAIKKHINDLKC